MAGAGKPARWEDAGKGVKRVDVGANEAIELVAIADGAGDQITSFGGGTQYTEGDTDASITGTAMLWEDTADTLRAVSAAKPLPVADAGGSLTVDGTVTANLAAGTNNIGDVDVLTVPADPFGANADAAATAGSTGSVQAKLRLMTSQLDAIQTAVQTLDNAISGSEIQADVLTAPARVRTTDSISAALATDRIMNNLTAVTPAFAIIDAATSGNNTLLSAQGASNKIRVHSAFMVAAAAVTVRFESGADGTALTGQMQLAANGGFVLPFNPLGWFETAANTLLNLELSGAISVDGCFQYSVVQ